MYLTCGTLWIVCLSQDSYSSALITHLSTVPAPVRMMSRNNITIAAVTFLWVTAIIVRLMFLWVTAVIVPLGFLFAFMFRTWASAIWLKHALLIAEANSWSIWSGGGTLWCPLNIRLVSAMLDQAIGAGHVLELGPTGVLCYWARGGTISHLLAGAGANIGLGSCCGLDCSCSSNVSFSCCFSCWHISGSPSCVVSACCEASSTAKSIFAALSLVFSLASCPGATLFMTIVIGIVLPAPHSLSSSWRVSHFCSLSCILVNIPSHCASSRGARASNTFVQCPTVRCSCSSFCACSRTILYIRLLQALGASKSPGHRSSFSAFHSRFPLIGSTIVLPEFFGAICITAGPVSIATSIGASLLLSPASPVSR